MKDAGLWVLIITIYVVLAGLFVWVMTVLFRLLHI